MRRRRMSGRKVIRWTPAVDPGRCQDATGGSGGGGNLGTPRNGAQDRDTSRTPPPRGMHGKMEEEERL